MAKIELKQPVVEEIKGYVDGAKSAVLVDYRGLTVGEDTELRKKLREEGVVYKVYKNTMLNFAFKGTDFETISSKFRRTNCNCFRYGRCNGAGKSHQFFDKNDAKIRV